MTDFLDTLAKDAMKTIEEEYYESAEKKKHPHISLKEAIIRFRKAPVISEVKRASPSRGIIRGDFDLKQICKEMEEGGAIGLSILTEPKHFRGRIDFVAEVRDQVKTPILMKDVILSTEQIDAASDIGADAVLLIQTLFNRGYCEKDCADMIDYSHSKGLEVLLEVHTKEEFSSALRSNADLIGINNRDLKTLKVDLGVTERMLINQSLKNDVIVSESGINSREDIRFLRKCGVKAFLVGTAIMKARSIKEKVNELVEAL
jgi:indole-3-glycerol phosphate synthase